MQCTKSKAGLIINNDEGKFLKLGESFFSAEWCLLSSLEQPSWVIYHINTKYLHQVLFGSLWQPDHLEGEQEWASISGHAVNVPWLWEEVLTGVKLGTILSHFSQMGCCLSWNQIRLWLWPKTIASTNSVFLCIKLLSLFVFQLSATGSYTLSGQPAGLKQRIVFDWHPQLKLSQVYVTNNNFIPFKIKQHQRCT